MNRGAQRRSMAGPGLPAAPVARPAPASRVAKQAPTLRLADHTAPLAPQPPVVVPRRPAAPLRVAYLMASAGLGGGELLLLDHLAHADRRRLWPLLVCGEHGPLTERAAALGVAVCVLPLQRTLALRRRRPPHPAMLWSLLRLLRRTRVALIHSYTLETQAVAHFAALLSGLPLVHSSQDTTWGAALRPHEWYLFNHLASRVVTTSQAVATSLHVGERLDSARCARVLPGIALERFMQAAEPPGLRQSLGLPDGAPVVGVVARLCAAKGWDVFLAAAQYIHRRCPAVRFLLVGDAVLPTDDYATQLQQQIDRLGLAGCCVRTGFRDDVPALLRCMDLLVSASPRESFGLVLVEAAASGRAVVSVRNGGAEEIVVDGVTGRLVPRDDSAALASAVLALLADTAALRRMGQQAQQHVARRFGIARMVDSFDRLYRRVLDEARAGAQSADHGADHPPQPVRTGLATRLRIALKALWLSHLPRYRG